jgi:hypothetical protein
MNLSTGKELEKAVWELFNQKQKRVQNTHDMVCQSCYFKVELCLVGKAKNIPLKELKKQTCKSIQLKMKAVLQLTYGGAWGGR